MLREGFSCLVVMLVNLSILLPLSCIIFFLIKPFLYHWSWEIHYRYSRFFYWSEIPFTVMKKIFRTSKSSIHKSEQWVFFKNRDELVFPQNIVKTDLTLHTQDWNCWIEEIWAFSGVDLVKNLILSMNLRNRNSKPLSKWSWLWYYERLVGV